MRERYQLQHHNIVETSPSDPSTDFAAQMSKLTLGVLTDRYVAPVLSVTTADGSKQSAGLGEEDGKVSTLEKYVVAPVMFKHLIGKGHPEFSSGRQQDVSEFFQYFLEVMGKAERVCLPRIALPGAADARPTPSIFEYHMEERFQCSQSGEVKYSKHGPQTLNNMLELPVPRDKAVLDFSASAASSGTTPTPKRARLEEKQDDDPDHKEYDMCADAPPLDEKQLLIPFTACLEAYLQPQEVEMHSPAVGGTTTFLKTQKFKSFPRYLMVKVARYYVGENWVQTKINARVDVPDELDLTALRASGPQPDEKLVSEDANTTATAMSTLSQFHQVTLRPRPPPLASPSNGLSMHQ